MTTITEQILDPVAVREFATKVSRYFLDFLETDFKKTQAPRRRVQLKTEAGFRTGVPLRKYDTLMRAVWNLLDKAVEEKRELRIRRGQFKAPVSPVLRNLIRQHISAIESKEFNQCRLSTIDAAKRELTKAVNDPESYTEEVKTVFAESVKTAVVDPLLSLLDGHFQKQSYSIIESVFEFQADLIAELCASVMEQLPSALNTYVVKGKLAPVEEVLQQFFNEGEAKQRLQDFFEDFSASDAYQEVRDIMHYARMGGENLQVYLYICEMRMDITSIFPVFYIPAAVQFDDKTGEIILTLDPHLFIHKAAIDYASQELGSAAKHALSPIENRILYLDGKQTVLNEMERILNRMSTVFDLSGDLDIRQPSVQSQESTRLKLTKAAYIAAFDKGDESLLNDYEVLLNAIDEDQQAVTQLFEDMIQAILIQDPISVRADVEADWEGMSAPQRLVAVSPIPLNEEQRKVLKAKRDPRCRFITLQGPPGAGKSHTITAIAFDCIQNNESILVLSDKKEALDVVEDKLSEVLSAARADDDAFPNPILRLGKTGGTYNRLISQSAQEKIRTYYASVRATGKTIANEATEIEKNLHQNIEKTIAAYTSVKFKDIEDLLSLEEKINKSHSGFTQMLRGLDKESEQLKLQKVLNELSKRPQALRSLGDPTKPMDLTLLIGIATAYTIAHDKQDMRQYRQALGFFKSLHPGQLPTLRQYIFRYEALRQPIFGYLFSRTRILQLNNQISSELGCTQPFNIHRRVKELKLVDMVVTEIGKAMEVHKSPEALCSITYRLLARDEAPPDGADIVKQLLESMSTLLTNNKIHYEKISIGTNGFASFASLIEFVVDCLRYARLWWLVNNVMGKPPEFDYVAEKSKLEQLNTVLMTHELDRRFISFVDNKSATAKTLGGVIRAKKQFPQDKFTDLKEALPCIIASIREFAEYVPLQKEIFDVVVIDEASQVSVAQALPAILRARKVIVLGDRKQFSNVKSAQASIAQNSGYLSDLDSHFKKRISNATDKIERLKAFDVKKSILDFFDLCANYKDMLRKHFRGYQELISFSSKHFYDGNLQAIKVRGKPIEEVIRFTELTPTKTPDTHRNVNIHEAEYILKQLREMVEQESHMTVGVITPFREQQQYLTKMLFNDEQAAAFEEVLDLKVMTFDTCQGEEREVIFYSMVATPTQDLLNYIFPVNLDNTSDRVEEMLKMQRLNVGFSRAEERMHFVISKPVAQFSGSIGRVLTHYQQILTDRSVPESSETDPSSPMEVEVLDWIKKTAFFQRNQKNIELQAQFRIGDYLRQLDPTYHHPSYRVDFLLRYRGLEKTVNVIIEYDGFAEHFTDHHKVHEGNYESFYRPQDIERQMVLESYGYKVLRINRFNMGEDPVKTLSDRLTRLVGVAVQHHEPNGISAIKRNIERVENGDKKICPRCEQALSIDRFYDPKLNGGSGGYGRLCRGCKRK